MSSTAPYACGDAAVELRRAPSQAERQKYDSKVKYLLYGGSSERPETPQHGQGKKSVSHAQATAAPFATYDAPAPQLQAQPYGQTYEAEEQQPVGPSPIATHMAKHKKEVTGKPMAPFDPEVYKAQRVANAANQAQSRQKAWGSGGIFGSQA